jgi:hypothetical protein
MAKNIFSSNAKTKYFTQFKKKAFLDYQRLPGQKVTGHKYKHSATDTSAHGHVRAFWETRT